MGISIDTKNGTYKVQYQKRHPLTRMPVVVRRKGIKTMAEARRVERDLVLRVEEKIRAKTIPKWSEVVDLWADDARMRDLMAKTIDNYLYSLRAYTFSKWGSRLVDQITTQEIKSIIVDDCRDRSDHQKQALLKFIRCVFQFALESDFINRNPVPSMKFRHGDKIKRVLTGDQVDRLLTQAKVMRCEWYYTWVLAVYTGMRNGELYALTWDKIDFENGLILVNCSWSRRNGLKSTKSGDDRFVPIAPALMTVLKELKLESGICSYVLPRIAKWEKGDQARELRFFLAGLGIEQCRFHDLRATFATLLLQKGVEPIKVMKAGGWKSLKTMMIYVRKAGVDIQGMTDDFNLHDPSRSSAQVYDLSQQIRMSPSV